MSLTEEQHRAQKQAAMKAKRQARAQKQMNSTLDEEKALLVDQFHDFYQTMHHDPKKFLGFSTKHYIQEIGDLVRRHRAKSLLDYGCGKGMQYLSLRAHDQWEGVLPYCYDPGVRGLHKKPDGVFDGVICCDVMEHIPELLVSDVIEELFSYAEKFVFANIALTPARKTLPNGQNAHVTLKSENWWRRKFDQARHEQEVLLLFSSDDQEKLENEND